jgi:hypothetical protein
MEKEFKEKIDMGLFETFKKNLKEEFRHEV